MLSVIIISAGVFQSQYYRIQVCVLFNIITDKQSEQNSHWRSKS